MAYNISANRVGVNPSEVDKNGKLNVKPLEPATADKLGGVKVGQRLTITEDGTLSADEQTYNLPIAGAETLGGVKIGQGVNIAEDGTISVASSDGNVEIINATADISTYTTRWIFSNEEYTKLITALNNNKYCIIKCKVGSNPDFQYGFINRSYGNTVSMTWVKTSNIYVGPIYSNGTGAGGYATLSPLIQSSTNSLSPESEAAEITPIDTKEIQEDKTEELKTIAPVEEAKTTAKKTTRKRTTKKKIEDK